MIITLKQNAAAEEVSRLRSGIEIYVTFFLAVYIDKRDETLENLFLSCQLGRIQFNTVLSDIF